MTCIYIFFHSRDPAMSPQGGLTMGQTAEGRSPPVEQSVGSWDRGRGADPHTWTSALQHGVPPYREQKELLADDSVSSADATTALPTGSSVNDRGVGCSCSSVLQAASGVAVE